MPRQRLERWRYVIDPFPTSQYQPICIHCKLWIAAAIPNSQWMEITLFHTIPKV